MASQLDDDQPVYVISVASELSGLHPQTLRQYERLGLVSPDRTGGRNRRYSMRDIVRLREVQDLASEGLNLAGTRTAGRSRQTSRPPRAARTRKDVDGAGRLASPTTPVTPREPQNRFASSNVAVTSPIGHEIPPIAASEDR